MLRAVAVVVLAGAASGCAKYPESGRGPASTRLLVTMTLAAPPNPNFVYIVAFNPSTDTNPTGNGPLPVIAPPWGNGFVAGNVRYFVRWDSAQSPRYLVYRFQTPDLLQFVATGVPINFVEPDPGSRQIRFEIELSQIASTLAEAESFRSVQVNFLTMDRVPQGGSGTKVWDALGDGRLPSGINQFVTIPLTISGTYNNDRFLDLEPTGDVADPSLDIVDWQIEVRRQ